LIFKEIYHKVIRTHGQIRNNMNVGKLAANDHKIYIFCCFSDLDLT